MKSLKNKFEKNFSNGLPSEQVDSSVMNQGAKKIAFFNKNFDYETQEEADETNKYDSDTDEFEMVGKLKNDSKSFGKKLSSKYKKRDTKREISSVKKEIFKNQSDSVSSSESGFGTVDDDLKNDKPNSELTMVASQSSVKLEPSENLLGLNMPNSTDCEKSSNLTQISFPILQPPKLAVYELNRSDDIVNILNDNSSINSSTSSNRKSNCLTRFLEKIYDFLCSCFCCYTSNPHQNQPIFCSWLTIFCCCCPLLGGISLLLNYRSKQYKNRQKYELADRYSGYAEKLNIAALIFGVIFYAIGFFILTLVLFIYWKVNHF